MFTGFLIMNNTLSIIIRSAGQRKTQILLAISSAFRQQHVDVTVIVVLNGVNVDLGLLAVLQGMDQVVVEYRKDFSLPDATLKGRQLVETEYFCYLDDDDFFLPDCLAKPCHILQKQRDIDVVACNGYFDNDKRRRLMFATPIELASNPMSKLFEKNWLASCGGVYRSSTVNERYFSVKLRYFEWTMIAFLLALDKRVFYLHQPVFVVNDTQESLSDSNEYLEANPRFLKSLLSYSIPKNIKSIIRHRYINSLHNVSDSFLHQKQYKKAWQYHLQSLCSFQGLKYLPFTIRLFMLPKPNN